MKFYITFLFISLFAFMSHAQSSCSSSRTIGADYNQAKYNCEVIINGNAINCQPYGNIWACACQQCPTNSGGGAGNNFRRTIGADYNQARYNCEVILNGRAGMCQPSTNNLWYCDCNY